MRFPFFAALAAFSISAAAADAFPDFASLPAQTAMPDPLIARDGSRITSKQAWNNRRRPELKRLFEHYMYGPIPPKPARVDVATTGSYPDFLGGKATLETVTISFGDPDAPKIDLMVVIPNARGGTGASGRTPVFLALNFCGNHAITEDPRVPLTRGWLGGGCKGCVTNRATDAARGTQKQDWPIEAIIDRGYAFATFCNTDTDSDRGDVSDGIYAWLARKGAPGASADPANRGTISAWAWGFHRCVDHLVTDRRLDPKRIAAVGHSRNGKTALLAAAFDERIALAIPHQAGCGGTAPSRGTIGESVKQINDRFPHWFNAAYKHFNDQPARLPFDQNALVALMAPRPVLLSNAQEDQWANPAGQFEVLKAAESTYKLFHPMPLATDTAPPQRRLVASPLGYYIREGRHSMNADDWSVFLNFADAHFHTSVR